MRILMAGVPIGAPAFLMTIHYFFCFFFLTFPPYIPYTT